MEKLFPPKFAAKTNKKRTKRIKINKTRSFQYNKIKAKNKKNQL